MERYVTLSMTGFSAAKGANETHSWAWELRSVNAKGLDLRLRVPDWISGLESGLRDRLSKSLARGSVAVSLRVQREEGAVAQHLNHDALTVALQRVAVIEEEAAKVGLKLAPTNAADLMAVKGVLETGAPEEQGAVLAKQLLADFEPVLASFLDMRAHEGEALNTILTGQLDEIAQLTDAAEAAVTQRKSDMDTALKAALSRVTNAIDQIEPERVAQELALIAVKADVTEELDRLRAHVMAARKLLSAKGPVGRKLDFLMQEFNREANTLCSKSQNTELTRIGLDLKTVIDQMREQVQNVE